MIYFDIATSLCKCYSNVESAIYKSQGINLGERKELWEESKLYKVIISCQVLTRDSVTVSVDAVVYYRVSNATISVANVENAHHSTRLLAQTTLRNILGTKTLHEILGERESISSSMQVSLVTTFPFLPSHNRFTQQHFHSQPTLPNLRTSSSSR